MENEKNTKYWIIPLVLIVLFAISMSELPYGFYTVLRICVCLLSVFHAMYLYADTSSMISTVPSILIAIIWNPIIPIYLERETWLGLDFIGICVEVVMAVYSFIVWKNNK